MGSNLHFLLDCPPPPGSLENLPDEPLVPTPVDTAGYLDDVYTVGQSPSGRWRSFIDCLKWEPRNYHDRILKKRAYHARTCWEATFLLSLTDSSWLSVGAFRMIQDVAHFEMRKVEIELLSFQLTAGMTGINVEDIRLVYDCSVIFYTTMVWFADQCIKNSGKSRGEQRQDRKEHAKFIHMKPFLHHGGKELGKNLDMMIHAVHTFLFHFPLDGEREVIGEVGRRLKMCIEYVDKVIVLLPNNNN